MGFEKKPVNTFLCPWIFLALISLNRVIITKALKIIVKCTEGGARRSEIIIIIRLFNKNCNKFEIFHIMAKKHTVKEYNPSIIYIKRLNQSNI